MIDGNLMQGGVIAVCSGYLVKELVLPIIKTLKGGHTNGKYTKLARIEERLECEAMEIRKENLACLKRIENNLATRPCMIQK